MHYAYFLLLLFVFAAGLYAAGRSDKYDDLIKDGTTNDITAAMKKDSDLSTYSVGENEDTLLMQAISYKRSKDIIKLLLDAGISPTKKNKLGQSAVSYVCKFCDDSKTAAMVLSYGTFTKSQIRTRLMTKDKGGKYAAQYIDENNSVEIQQLVKSYLLEKDIALLSGTTFSRNDNLPSETPPPAPVSQNTVPSEAPVASGPVTETVSEKNIQPDLQSSIQNTASIQSDSNGAVKLPPSDTGPVQPPKATAYKKTSLYDYASDDSTDDNLPDTSAADPKFIPDADTADPAGVTPLMTALKNGNDWEVDALLYSGANINAADNEGWTPLMYAVRYQNNEKLVRTLIDHGAKTQVQNKYSASPLIIAAEYSENSSILSLLLPAYTAGEEEVFKALVFTITGTTSADRIKLAKVQFFLDKGVQLNRFWEGKTPLMYAAETCSTTSLIDLLLKNGAIISTRTTDRKTAFDFAKANTKLPHDQIYWSLNTGR